LGFVGGVPYITGLPGHAATPMNGPYYAQIVSDVAVRRRLISAGQRIAQMGQVSHESDLERISALAQAELDSVAAPKAVETIGLTEHLTQVLEEMENPGGVISYPSGLRALDEVYRGAFPGRLDVIAARPAVGKSVLAANLMRKIGIALGIPLLFFSLEMSTAEILQRVISAEAKVNLSRIADPLRGGPTPEDWGRVARVTPSIAAAPVEIYDRPMGLAQIVQETRAGVKRGVKVVIVDYLQLMDPPARAESRQVAVSANIDGLKRMGKDLGVAVICLSQLNRNVDKRGDGVPRLSDLRESGSIEQSADCVILIHRPDAEDPESPRAGEADLIVAKQRNGRTGIATVVFRGHYAQFCDFAPEPR
jgi:replicative DNA helicase